MGDTPRAAQADYEDPWYEQKQAVDPKRLAEELEAREQLIDALPAGSISGGQIVYDPSDQATWYLSDNPEERRYAKEFLHAYDPLDPENPNYGSGPRDGLGHREKNMLRDLARREVYGGFSENGAPHEGLDFRRQDKDQKDLTQAATELWPEYALRHGELAQDKAGAAAAMKYLVDTSGLSKRDLVTLARSEQRNELLDHIAEAQYNFQLTGTGGSPAPARYTEDDHRTAISSGSYSTGHVRGSEADMEVRSAIELKNSIFGALDDMQKKGGWHR